MLQDCAISGQLDTRSPTQGLRVVGIHTWALDLTVMLTWRCFLEVCGPSTPSDDLQCLLCHVQGGPIGWDGEKGSRSLGFVAAGHVSL